MPKVLKLPWVLKSPAAFTSDTKHLKRLLAQTVSVSLSADSLGEKNCGHELNRWVDVWEPALFHLALGSCCLDGAVAWLLQGPHVGVRAVPGDTDMGGVGAHHST